MKGFVPVEPEEVWKYITRGDTVLCAVIASGDSDYKPGVYDTDELTVIDADVDDQIAAGFYRSIL